jgi:hypothetical protein
VVLQLKKFGDITDRGFAAAWKTADGQQELLLIGCQTFPSGGFLREAKKHAQCMPDLCERLVLAISQLGGRP